MMNNLLISMSVSKSVSEKSTPFVVTQPLLVFLVQEAVNFVRLRLSDNGDLSTTTKALTKLALDQGSVDNVSVVLVWFQGKIGDDKGEAEAVSS